MSPVVYRLVRTTPSRAALPPLVVVVRIDRHGLPLVVLAAPRAPMSSAVHRLVRSLPPVAHYVDLAQSLKSEEHLDHVADRPSSGS